jgi:hypothetical protein
MDAFAGMLGVVGMTGLAGIVDGVADIAGISEAAKTVNGASVRAIQSERSTIFINMSPKSWGADRTLSVVALSTGRSVFT